MAFSENGQILDGGAVYGAFISHSLVDDDSGYARGPERALMSALLFDGIQAYMSYAECNCKAQRSRFREAFNWVHCCGNEYVFSFESVCEGLGIDANFIRYGLLNAFNSKRQWKKARRNF